MSLYIWKVYYFSTSSSKIYPRLKNPCLTHLPLLFHKILCISKTISSVHFCWSSTVVQGTEVLTPSIDSRKGGIANGSILDVTSALLAVQIEAVLKHVSSNIRVTCCSIEAVSQASSRTQCSIKCAQSVKHTYIELYLHFFYCSSYNQHTLAIKYFKSL